MTIVIQAKNMYLHNFQARNAGKFSGDYSCQLVIIQTPDRSDNKLSINEECAITHSLQADVFRYIQ